MIDDPFAALTVEGVMSKVFHELDSLNTAEPSLEWGARMIQVLRFTQGFEVGFTHAKAYALAIIKEHWDDLPFEFRREHGFSFMEFARLYTGKERSTIDNYINTAKVWFIDKIKPLGRIKVIERAPDGKPLKEGGIYQTTEKEFNPFLVDMSKLLLLNSRASRGKMTERLWEMLVDDFYTCEDVSLESMGGLTPDGTGMSLRFFIEGPGLYAQYGPDVICIAEELNWEDYEQGGLSKDAINRLLLVLNITLDEDAIYKITHRANAVTP